MAMLNNQMVYSHKSMPVLSTTSESRENTPAIPVFLLFGHVGNWVISQFDIYIYIYIFHPHSDWCIYVYVVCKYIHTRTIYVISVCVNMCPGQL